MVLAEDSYFRNGGDLHSCGNNIFFQPRKYPSDPKLISLGNNIAIATNVTFINHDVMHHVFNNIEQNSTDFYMGSIIVNDNVFIGANSIILPDVVIEGDNIIAAGSVVTKNVKKGSIVAGVPAKKIGEFDNVFNKRKLLYDRRREMTREEIIQELWQNIDNNEELTTHSYKH